MTGSRPNSNHQRWPFSLKKLNINRLKSEATTLDDAKGLISSLGMRAYALIIIKRTQDADIRLTVSKAYPFQ